MITLGIDTSNYTTSCALFDSEKNVIFQQKKLLSVKPGEKGLRQSDAVFHHTQQLYQLIDKLFSENRFKIDVVGVSDKPRDVEGSYMPCFSVGLNVASSISSVLNVPIYTFSHQSGHIMASLFSSESKDLMDNEFLAFHVSGGTTELLHVIRDDTKVFKSEIVGCSLDLNCGQAIDRVGVMMGLSFPCGGELEKLASLSTSSIKPKICVKDGNCSLSGVENQCRKMIDENKSSADIAKYCLDFVFLTIDKMAEHALNTYGDLPIVFAGGVMSDKIIREKIESKYNAKFAEPDFSCDNAAGTAILAYYRSLYNA